MPKKSLSFLRFELFFLLEIYMTLFVDRNKQTFPHKYLQYVIWQELKKIHPIGGSKY